MLSYIKLKQHIKNYILATSGAAIVAFGITVPAIVTSVGVAVDLSQAYMVRERLGRALDAAALAAGASAADDEVTARAQAFFNANFRPEKIGTAGELNVSINGGSINVKASATVDTAFMKIFGVNYVEVAKETTVVRQIRGIEVVMVLDNTGSMNTNNNIGALKTASTNFVNILFDRVKSANHVRIGMVPYSSSVNVGPFGLGFDETGAAYGAAFVENPASDVYENYGTDSTTVLYNESSYGIDPADLIYDPASYGQWHGCVLAEPYPLDTEDHTGPWGMYRYDFNGSTNNWYQNIYSSPYTNGDNYNSYYGPNYHCPDQHVVPLTSTKQKLLDAIQNMNADGFTLGNYGMVWGWRVVSPEAPFTEGAEWTDDQWEKAVLMMTDGINTMNHAYTAYEKTNTHNVRASDENARFAEVCDSMKEEGILIYTVTFYSNVDDNTKDFYKECATDPTKYFDAPSQDDLVAVFEKISRELSNLHISE